MHTHNPALPLRVQTIIESGIARLGMVVRIHPAHIFTYPWLFFSWQLIYVMFCHTQPALFLSGFHYKDVASNGVVVVEEVVKVTCYRSFQAGSQNHNTVL